MKRKKLPSIPSLRRKLDRVFSVWIRQRASPGNWIGSQFRTCVTCGAQKNWKDLQCGHYYSRVHTATRYEPKNAHPCCSKCNVLLRGNYPAYARFMLATYGQAVLDELEAKSKTTVKFTRQDYLDLIERFS